jgi:hypothetical protein
MAGLSVAVGAGIGVRAGVGLGVSFWAASTATVATQITSAARVIRERTTANDRAGLCTGRAIPIGPQGCSESGATFVLARSNEGADASFCPGGARP